MAAEMVEGIGDMKSIGQVAYEALTPFEDSPRYEGQETSIKWQFEHVAKAVLLHALDLLAAAGVTPADAAGELRAGKTLEEVCKPMDTTGVYVALDPAKPGTEETKRRCVDHQSEPGAYGVCRRCGAEINPEGQAAIRRTLGI